jgi:hypothetical protein
LRRGSVTVATRVIRPGLPVHFDGTHSVDVDGELAKLDADGYRTPRATAAAEAS